MNSNDVSMNDSRIRSISNDDASIRMNDESFTNEGPSESAKTESGIDDSTDNESSSDDLPIAFFKKLKANIVISDDEDKNVEISSGSTKKWSIGLSQNSTTPTMLTASSDNKRFSSFVDSNLFVDESPLNTSSSLNRTRRTSKKSSSRSFNKSFTKYRAKGSLSSDEEMDGNGHISTTNRSTENQATRSSNMSSSDLELVIDDSDDDDDKYDAECERNVFSPRTRMSITGLGNISDLSDSDDEIPSRSSVLGIEEMQPIEIPDSDEETNDNVKEIIEDNAIEITDDSDMEIEDHVMPNRSHQKKTFNRFSLATPLQASSPISKPMRQPKITTLAKVFVSQEFFDKQVMKLNDMENDLHRVVQLQDTLHSKLSSDVKLLSARIDRLKQNIRQQQEYIQSLEIQTSFEQNEIKAPAKVIEVSWDALDAATNEVKPKYTGATGLKTFNTQKVMTLDTLKEIHGSISTCPTPDTYAKDPQGLKVELMPHQKYALEWLKWRETQKPRGGILADDMGLGKTLSIIAHVLAAKYSKENNSADDDDSDEKENSNTGWAAKGRKDHYSGGTLIVCPASLIGQWESEIKNRVNRNLLTYVVHHGTKRDVKPRHLATNDIVITTYNIVLRECNVKSKGPLSTIKWGRVVLDEAHVIRNHKSRMSESVSSLNRRLNWILTGTPIQNKEVDMFALLRFLKCRPFDDMGHFKKWIDNKNAGGQLRMNTILKAILLRRTKAELIASGGILNMPSKTVNIVEVTLDKDEMNVYQKIMLYSQTLFAQYLHQRAEKGDRYDYDYKKPAVNTAYQKAHKMLAQMHAAERDVKSHEILVLLLRLRQICCHPGLITAMLEDEDKNTALDDSSTSNHDSMDIDLLEELDKLNVDGIETGTFELPADDSRMTKASQKVLYKSNPVFDFSRPSSKFLKVLDVLKKHVLPKNENAVIVSQWTHVLEVIGMTLRRNGIAYTSLTGSVPVKDRGAIVEHFNKMSEYSKVLLLSLTAGGVGLNLVGGNHLLLVDLHWNPQLEAQAQDRVYRVGQTKSVSIYKFVCTNTIEQRIKQLQDKKLEIANGVLTGSGSKGSKLSIDDLKSLFDI